MCSPLRGGNDWRPLGGQSIRARCQCSFSTVQEQCEQLGPESATWCQLSLHHDGEDIALDLACHSYVDDAIRKIVTEEPSARELSRWS
eukprot:201546-Pyramimonas_sp.AAC.1